GCKNNSSCEAESIKAEFKKRKAQEDEVKCSIDARNTLNIVIRNSFD
ncbi:hypothetical protein Tco_0075708, partial [Tanacetum coccineum]